MKRFCLFLFFVAVALASLFFIVMTDEVPLPEVAPCDNECSFLSKGYFNNSIVVVFDYDDPKVLSFDFYRKQIEEGYEHYYYLNLYADDGFSSYISEVFADEVIRYGKFEVTEFSDFSTRANYDVNIVVKGNEIVFNEDFDADFITKNDLSYTRYSGVTEGEIIFNGVLYDAFFYLENSYAADYSKLVYFPGLNDLQSVTQRFVLFDEVGNFYLLDNTVVSEDNPYYPSHSWYLQKESGLIKKGFDLSVDRIDDSRFPAWEFEYENKTFKISALDILSSSWSDGRIAGTVEVDGEIRALQGMYSFKQE